MSRLLLLEDDESLIDGLVYTLKKNEFEIRTACSVKEAMKLLDGTNQFDLLLLDVSLPDGTGFEVCEQVRNSGNRVPIIFLTANDEETSIIRGLDSGGDDYITKPFKIGELCSRIKALLRRAGQEYENSPGNKEAGILKSGNLTIDLIGSRVELGGKVLELTALEYRLLCVLVRNENRVMTRQAILDVIWDGNGDFVDDNTLSVYVRRLREKLGENKDDTACLQTIRGFGYMWKRG